MHVCTDRNEVRSFNHAHNSCHKILLLSTASFEDSLSQHTHGKVSLSSLAAGKVPGETGLYLLVRNGNLPALRALRGTRLVGKVDLLDLLPSGSGPVPLAYPVAFLTPNTLPTARLCEDMSLVVFGYLGRRLALRCS